MNQLSPSGTESISTVLKEITMTVTVRHSNNTNHHHHHIGTAKNIYRQSNLPRKRLFTSKNNGSGSNKRWMKSFWIVICIFIFMIMFLLILSSLSSPSSLQQGHIVGQNMHNENNQIVNSKNNNVNIVGDASVVDALHTDISIKTSHDNNKNEFTLTDHNDDHEEQQKEQERPFDKCAFRKYKSNRYYKVGNNIRISEQESFLSDADYIRGKQPFVINPLSKISSSTKNSSLMPTKLCFNTSDWEDVLPNHYPFSDGQNPSIVSLASNVYNLPNNDNVKIQNRIDKQYISPLHEIYNDEHPYALHDLFLGLLLFGDSQCRWNLNEDELKTRKFSPLTDPPTKRSMVLILNEEMNVIDSTVLTLELDEKWGMRKKLHVSKNSDGSYEKKIVELDDARLFFHNGQLHVLYRNGPYYGYEKQVQNPIHFKKIEGDKFEAFIKSSETFTICCGRNIAFISERPESINTTTNDSETNELLALTWIDPVTTEVVQVIDSSTSTNTATNTRRILLQNNFDDLRVKDSHHPRRKLKGGKKSHIHGTNGYMLPLHSTSELLGIAHFHRPEGRETSDYARHGHHYTHAFFTIKLSTTTNKYHLNRLSNEFIFMAPSSDDDNTGDVIQFTSGLDLVGSDKDGRLLISYGINDCEAATFFLGMDTVHEMLIEVEEGLEVVNLMEKLQ